MLSSTRDIAPSCVENVDELIERQEKSLVQLDNKRAIVKDLIDKGKKILENPDKPRFLEGHVKRIEVGWDDTKQKAQDRLKLLQETKDAWVGYAENNEKIAAEFDKAEEEMKKVKKRFNLAAALEDLKKRQDIFNTSNNGITGLFNSINANFKCMCITLPEDKKKIVDKEIKAVSEKLEVAGRFKEKVDKLAEFCVELTNFDSSLKAIDAWMMKATAELDDIKNSSGAMVPEDRVARTMDLQEDIAAKMEILAKNAALELELLPQGRIKLKLNFSYKSTLSYLHLMYYRYLLSTYFFIFLGDKVPADAQEFKDELARITKYVTDLQAQTKVECNKYSEDVKYWAEYRTGIKEFTPWIINSERACTEGLPKPSTLDEVKALDNKVAGFAKSCENYLKILVAADDAAKKMTSRGESDKEVAALKERFDKVKQVSDGWVAKVATLLKEWILLDTTVTELNSWVAKDKTTEGENQFSLEKMESTLGELKNIFKEKEKLVENL